MTTTKNQIKRLEILDELLGRKKCAQEELLSYVNEKLLEEGKTIDKRTLFRDIKYLVDEKNAPIHRPETGDEFYYYEEKFSIKNVPLDEDDVSVLKKAIVVLKQVDDFSMMKEVEDVIRKLENKIHSHTEWHPSIVQFEKHTKSLGHEHLDNLMDAIESKVPVKVLYLPFIYQKPSERIVHPYLLKEFRNRWFLIGRDGNSNLASNYALDRIKSIKNLDTRFIENNLFDPEEYFNNSIGVSIPRGARAETIEIKVYRECIPYVLSKPIHYSQTLIEENKDAIVIQLNLIINFELKSVLLSYGPGIEVKKPPSLREAITEELAQMQNFYR